MAGFSGKLIATIEAQKILLFNERYIYWHHPGYFFTIPSFGLQLLKSGTKPINSISITQPVAVGS